MPHGNCLAMPQVTAVDEQFGTHRPERRGRGRLTGSCRPPGDVALQTADELSLVDALGGVSGHIAVGSFVQTSPESA